MGRQGCQFKTEHFLRIIKQQKGMEQLKSTVALRSEAVADFGKLSLTEMLLSDFNDFQLR